MEVPIATYTQHEKAEKHFPARRAAEYGAFFGITPEFLLYGRGEDAARVPILDKYGQPTGRTAPLPPEPSTLTVAVENDAPGICSGMVAIYNRPQGALMPAVLINRLCVVAIPPCNGQGERLLVRLVQAGSGGNRYHLIGADMPMFDQEVKWLAPVIALVPA